MKTSFLFNKRQEILILLTCFGVIFSIFTHSILACSWDYPIWQIRSKNADPFYRFVINHKAGFINQNGKVIIEPILEDTYGNHGEEFHDGLLNMLSWEGPYLDKSGKTVIANDYYRTSGFSEGLAVSRPNDGDKLGYIDTTGKIVIPPQFDLADDFSEGFAPVSIENQDGYIDKSGSFIISPKFLRANDFHEGLAAVIVEGPCKFYSDDPCAMDNPPQLYPRNLKEDANFPFCKFGFIDKKGREVTGQRFERVKHFQEGLAAVKIDGKWGYIDKSGKIVINPQFYDAQSFSDGLAVIQPTSGLLFGFIDKTGKTVIKPQFKRAEHFSDGLAPVAVENKKTKIEEYFFINRNGQQTFNKKFAEASHFYKGIAHVKLLENHSEDDFYLNGKFSYINTQGKAIFSYENKGED